VTEFAWFLTLRLVTRSLVTRSVVDSLWTMLQWQRSALPLLFALFLRFFLPAAVGDEDRVVAAAGRPPNILLIVADDLGWGDLGCYGNPLIDTPVMDALAAEGVRLTSCYAASPLCAPSRAALLTGRYNHRSGAVDVPSNRGLDRIALSQPTLGDFFQQAGWQTTLIGKWHNGVYCDDYLPHHRGFARFTGFANGGQDYWRWNLQRNDAPFAADGRYLSDVLNEEACTAIRTAGDQPFLIALMHHAPHSPLQAPEDLIRKYQQRLGKDSREAVAVIYAMIEAMDTGLGRVLATLEDCGQRDHTLIVLTSDNGPFLGRDSRLGPQHRFNGSWSGQKQDVLEGGIRVPGIVSWPGRVTGGRVVDEPIHGCDWLPTLLAACLPDQPDLRSFDGRNVLPLLQGSKSAMAPRRALFFQRNRYHPEAYSNAAVIEGRWKLYWPGIAATMRKDLLRDNPAYLRGIVRPHWEMPLDRQLQPPGVRDSPVPMLFDLLQDPAETTDVAAENPQVVAGLSAVWDKWFIDVMTDWHAARDEILIHDRAYWRDRPSPDPRVLYDSFWLWDRVPDLNQRDSDPLQVFQGYWSQSAASELR